MSVKKPCADAVSGAEAETVRSKVTLPPIDAEPEEIAQERQWAKDGTLARLYREGARKRRELTKLGNEHDEE